MEMCGWQRATNTSTNICVAFVVPCHYNMYY